MCAFCESGEKDNIVHALSKYKYTKIFLTDDFDLIDPYRRFAQWIDTENFIFLFTTQP